MLCVVALKYIPATAVAIYRRCYFRLPDSLLILLSKYYRPVIGSGVRVCCDSGRSESLQVEACGQVGSQRRRYGDTACWYRGANGHKPSTIQTAESAPRRPIFSRRLLGKTNIATRKDLCCTMPLHDGWILTVQIHRRVPAIVIWN